MQKITPFLWFDDKAEEAVNFYISLFSNSKITGITRYSDDVPGPKGKVMSITFELSGQKFMALNGGPGVYTFSGAISFFITCESQEEVDRLYEKLSRGGEEIQCGWVKDKFGVTWQVVPAVLEKLLNDPDSNKVKRVTKAMLSMKKLDIKLLEQAAEG